MENSPSVNLEATSLSDELLEQLREKTGFLITGYPGQGHAYAAKRTGRLFQEKYSLASQWPPKRDGH